MASAVAMPMRRDRAQQAAEAKSRRDAERTDRAVERIHNAAERIRQATAAYRERLQGVDRAG